MNAICKWDIVDSKANNAQHTITLEMGICTTKEPSVKTQPRYHVESNEKFIIMHSTSKKMENRATPKPVLNKAF